MPPLRGAVELGQHDAGDVDDLGEHARLLQPVLAGRRVEHEQHLVDRRLLLDDALDLAELVHQPGLGVQPAGGVDEHDVDRRRRSPPCTASNATLAGSAPSAPRTVRAPTRSPQVCSWSAAAARNVSAAPSRTRPAVGHEHPRELAGGGGLAGAVDADDQHHRRASGRARSSGKDRSSAGSTSATSSSRSRARTPSGVTGALRPAPASRSRSTSSCGRARRRGRRRAGSPRSRPTSRRRGCRARAAASRPVPRVEPRPGQPRAQPGEPARRAARGRQSSSARPSRRPRRRPARQRSRRRGGPGRRPRLDGGRAASSDPAASTAPAADDDSRDDQRRRGRQRRVSHAGRSGRWRSRRYERLGPRSRAPEADAVRRGLVPRAAAG